MFMKSVGEKLRRERIDRGIDLATLAGTTRISQRYLEAIESGDAETAPGGFFYRSFVRQYATALGMEMNGIEAELERAREAEAPALGATSRKSEFPVKPPDPIVAEANRRVNSGRMRGSLALLVAVLIGCSAFYSWWRRLETSVAARQETATEPRAVSLSAETTKGPAAQPAANAGPIGVPVTSSAGGVSAPPVADPAAVPMDGVVLNLAATELVWVSVLADGKTIFAGILHADETKTLAAKEEARIRVGNAGALDVISNGKSIGPLGPRGQIRTVVLTPAGYRVMAPTGPPADPASRPSGAGGPRAAASPPASADARGSAARAGAAS